MIPEHNSPGHNIPWEKPTLGQNLTLKCIVGKPGLKNCFVNT